jgi:putative ABC transport system ATP-binding protein
MEGIQAGSDNLDTLRGITMIEVKDVHKTYFIGGIRVDALRGVSLKIHEGEFAFIIGPSGSGKTTLLDIMGALMEPTKGKVLLDGKDISRFDDFQLSMFRRRKIGFIFQGYNLVPTLNALENVLIPHMPEGVTEEQNEKAMELLEEVGLSDRMYHRPNELSGGQQQRVAIARSLINDPVIILADEPTGELDHKTGHEIFDYMRKMNEEEGKTFVVVTHDVEYIKKGDRVFKLHDGQLVDHGK